MMYVYVWLLATDLLQVLIVIEPNSGLVRAQVLP